MRIGWLQTRIPCPQVQMQFRSNANSLQVGLQDGQEIRGTFMQEGRILGAIAQNVVVKLPLTLDGLKACKHFTEDGFRTNVTLYFSANQALMAAKAGATYVSPFIGRLDDTNIDGMAVIHDIRRIFDNYDFETQILAASIRTPNHVREAALIGADAATMPTSTLRALIKHPLTDKGLEGFVADWAKTGQTII
jgi:transaldolase